MNDKEDDLNLPPDELGEPELREPHRHHRHPPAASLPITSYGIEDEQTPSLPITSRAIEDEFAASLPITSYAIEDERAASLPITSGPID
jgi:hypothetical protein